MRIVSRISYKQEAHCFACVNFIGCTYAGDIECKKEKSILGVADYLTIKQCKVNGWFKEIKHEIKD